MLLVACVAIGMIPLVQCTVGGRLGDGSVAVTIDQSSATTHWEIHAYGVLIDVSLSAPRSVVTMVEDSFIASAQLVSIDDGPSHTIRAVYISTLSLYIPRPAGGGWSFSASISGSSENMTVGETKRVSRQVIISAGSCYLAPGQTRLLVCYVGVELGVDTVEGALHTQQDVFEYPFEVVAGSDAADQRWLVGLTNLSSLSLLLLLGVVFVGYAFKARRRSNR